jgi:4-diphosphocytidyl-2-C-methyl-D-erythritol kinase
MAPAKLTRSLRVVGRRADGRHLLDAEMVALDLADELEISRGNALTVVDEIDWFGQAPKASWDDQPNLVNQALRAVRRSASVRLRKRIPPGAGLGGGSADAAAVLRWAGCTDVVVAAGLGSDVPFCLTGGRARVSGVGDVIQPLPFEASALLLVVPRLHVSTPAVYAAWDSLGGPVGESDNDLEPAAISVEPRLAWWRDLVSEAAGRRARLAGSGGTWWLEGGREELAGIQQRVMGAITAAGEAAVIQLAKTIPAPGT